METLMKVTIIGYYLADPDDYNGETDPPKMASIDAENVTGQPFEAVCLMDEDQPFTITVEPAQQVQEHETRPPT